MKSGGVTQDGKPIGYRDPYSPYFHSIFDPTRHEGILFDIEFVYGSVDTPASHEVSTLTNWSHAMLDVVRLSKTFR